jgi:thiosulfate dehydrogenase (quinone) large subunit
MATATTADANGSSMIAMDLAARIRIPRAGAITAAILRIGIGLIYLWAFLSQGFGITYTNQAVSQGSPVPPSTGYSWNFSYDPETGWISSGFETSPTERYVDGTDGPLAFIPQDLPVGVVDAGWLFAIGGLGVALTLGICSRIAGWGGLILNLLIWFAAFPPSNNPIFDADHFLFAFTIFLLMWLQASNRWGIGRWWRARTPGFLH